MGGPKRGLKSKQRAITWWHRAPVHWISAVVKKRSAAASSSSARFWNMIGGSPLGPTCFGPAKATMSSLPNGAPHSFGLFNRQH